jgi:thioredoxin-related protein
MADRRSLSRRTLLLMSAALGAGCLLPSHGRAAPVAGFATQPWFAETSFDLAHDLDAASKAGKRLVLLWEQKGCEYCRAMHELAMPQADLIEIAKPQFHVIQMDMRGTRAFKDFAGAAAKESDLARGFFVRGTPTTQVFDEAGKEVFRMPGYASPEIFFLVYQYVAERGYLSAKLEDWAAKKYAQ